MREPNPAAQSHSNAVPNIENRSTAANSQNKHNTVKLPLDVPKEPVDGESLDFVNKETLIGQLQGKLSAEKMALLAESWPLRLRKNGQPDMRFKVNKSLFEGILI